MISILIPTYNFIIVDLVKQLHLQCTRLNIDFEIICLDDGSQRDEIILANRKINKLTNVLFEELAKNVGRSAIRNKLTAKAKYNWLLFLDADVIPISETFVAKYLETLQKRPDVKVLYGGRKHLANGNNNLLRWKYGFYQEDRTKKDRNKKPYLSIITNNLLVNRSIAQEIKFDESLKKYGHEDTLFSYHLKLKQIKVLHLSNPVYHKEIDSNQDFISKTELGLQNLSLLCKNGSLPYNYTKISSYYLKLKKFHLNFIFNLVFKIFEVKMKQNLLSNSPSLKVFTLYKFSYFCNLEK